MKKVYARQIPPEYQGSPLFLGDEFWPDDVFVYGNHDYNEHGNISEYIHALEEIADVFENMQSGYGWTKDLGYAIRCEVPSGHCENFTRAQRLEIVKLAKQYTESNCGSYDEEQALLLFLELLNGKEYAAATIRGCCQGEWQKIIFPSSWTPAAVEEFETEYFNTGSEWTIHDEEDDPESPEEISGYTVYCHGWSDDQIRAEIAEAAGENPADVVLYKFSSWSRSANYEIA